MARTDISRFRPSRSVFNSFLRIFFPQPPSPEVLTDIFPRMTRPHAKIHRVPGSAKLRRLRHRASYSWLAATRVMARSGHVSAGIKPPVSLHCYSVDPL